MTHPIATLPATCTNCGATLHGRYCHSCGQKSVSSRLSLREFAHEAVHELAHLDGKIVQTLKRLVFSPGALTNEILAGRRARYVPPLRLYLTCSILFFALATLAPQTTGSVLVVRQSGSHSESAKPAMTVEEIRTRVLDSILHNMPRAMFALLPLFAFFTWAFYRKAQPYYVAHLYHALHLHAFVFLLMALWIVLSVTGQYGRFVARFVMLAIIPYYYVGLSRVFGGSKLKTLVKGTTVGILYWISLIATLLGFVMLGLRK